MSVVLTVVLFVAMLFLLITCHELGHFLASRRAGIVVEEFGIGFPPRLFAFKRGDTVYSINLIPVGAFVRPVGEDDPKVEGGLAAKGPWTRMGVYAAGPLVNIVLALVFITTFYMSVVTTHIDGNQGVMVQSVDAGYPAEGAGIMRGDVIVSIDDSSIATVDDVSRAVNEGPTEVKAVLIQRDGVDLPPVMIQPRYNDQAQRHVLGVTLSSWLNTVTGVDPASPASSAVRAGDVIIEIGGRFVYSRESFAEELARASQESQDFAVVLERNGTAGQISVTLPSSVVSGGAISGVDTAWVQGAWLEESRRSPWEAISDTGSFIAHLPSLFKESLPLMRDNPGSALVGPVGAAQLTVEVVKVGGLASILFLGGFISISLALFNFLPVPPLDGGGMLIALIEGIRRGKRLPQQTVRTVYLIGTILMVMLFIIVFYGDISRLIRGEGFPGL